MKIAYNFHSAYPTVVATWPSPTAATQPTPIVAVTQPTPTVVSTQLTQTAALSQPTPIVAALSRPSLPATSS